MGGGPGGATIQSPNELGPAAAPGVGNAQVAEPVAGRDLHIPRLIALSPAEVGNVHGLLDIGLPYGSSLSTPPESVK